MRESVKPHGWGITLENFCKALHYKVRFTKAILNVTARKLLWHLGLDFLLFFIEEIKTLCSWPKMKRTIQTVQSNKPRSQGHHTVQRCFSGLGKGDLYFCDGSINAEKYTEQLSSHQAVIPSTSMHFSTKQCKSTLQRRSCRGRGCWTDLPAVLTCPQRKICGEFQNDKYSNNGRTPLHIWRRVCW